MQIPHSPELATLMTAAQPAGASPGQSTGNSDFGVVFGPVDTAPGREKGAMPAGPEQSDQITWPLPADPSVTGLSSKFIGFDWPPITEPPQPVNWIAPFVGAEKVADLAPPAPGLPQKPSPDLASAPQPPVFGVAPDPASQPSIAGGRDAPIIWPAGTQSGAGRAAPAVPLERDPADKTPPLASGPTTAHRDGQPTRAGIPPANPDPGAALSIPRHGQPKQIDTLNPQELTVSYAVPLEKAVPTGREINAQPKPAQSDPDPGNPSPPGQGRNPSAAGQLGPLVSDARPIPNPGPGAAPDRVQEIPFRDPKPIAAPLAVVRKPDASTIPPDGGDSARPVIKVVTLDNLPGPRAANTGPLSPARPDAGLATAKVLFPPVPADARVEPRPIKSEGHVQSPAPRVDTPAPAKLAQTDQSQAAPRLARTDPVPDPRTISPAVAPELTGPTPNAATLANAAPAVDLGPAPVGGNGPRSSTATAPGRGPGPMQPAAVLAGHDPAAMPDPVEPAQVPLGADKASVQQSRPHHAPETPRQPPSAPAPASPQPAVLSPVTAPAAQATVPSPPPSPDTQPTFQAPPTQPILQAAVQSPPPASAHVVAPSVADAAPRSPGATGAIDDNPAEGSISLGEPVTRSTPTVHGMAPPADAQVARNVAVQLADIARLMPDQPVEITLDPEELGRVRMTLHATDGAMLVSLNVERPETADLLRRHIDTLAQDFRSMGYRDVAFEFNGGRNHPGSQGRQDPAQTSDSRAASATRAPDSADPHTRTPTVRGMDLRV
jgi:hypothetical protein